MVWQEFLEEFYAKFTHPEKLGHLLFKILNIIVIIVVIFFAFKLITWILKRYLRKHKERRALTIIPLINSLLRYLAFFIAIIAVLREFGVNYGAILAGAGVIGLAVGFGAQTLIRDFISGFFILFEDLISVGDVINVGNESGTVEKIGLRTTQYREFSGILRTIPNGELTRFGNFNRDFMRVIVPIDFDYDFDINKGFKIIEQIAQAWAKENQSIIMEQPIVQGVIGFGKAGITLRIVAKVQPQTQWQAERELRLLIKTTLDQLGIGIPFDQQTVHVKQVNK
ncbi:MAG: mechanosensitive ion channel family protein [Candidatus Latescibacteria bacterium]|nr:mechanosensitive ion channel family protein [Candidatus Latescibacterota bacterium]